ncbi:disease resistance-like protein DSC1 [Prunus dulcis]|nr:disease resistance-like protein DSC1 [Prunus dulcis]
MATASSEFKEDKIEQPSYDSDSYGSYDDFVEELLRQRSFVGNICCGNEIPNWFSHKSEGCSIKIELPPNWFSTDFLGFALSIVVAYKRGYALSFVRWFRLGCKYNFKTSNGKSREVNHPWCNLLTNTGYRDSPEVFVWCYNNVFEEVVEGAHSPTAFYKFVTEVNVDFTVQSYDGYEEEEGLEVKKCGICLLYGKGAEMMKQRALYTQDF